MTINLFTCLLLYIVSFSSHHPLYDSSQSWSSSSSSSSSFSSHSHPIILHVPPPPHSFHPKSASPPPYSQSILVFLLTFLVHPLTSSPSSSSPPPLLAGPRNTPLMRARPPPSLKYSLITRRWVFLEGSGLLRCRHNPLCSPQDVFLPPDCSPEQRVCSLKTLQCAGLGVVVVWGGLA